MMDLGPLRLSMGINISDGVSTSFSRFAAPPMGNVLLSSMLLTSYLLMSKLVTAFSPLNLIAAMSYASAASSCVPLLFHIDPTKIRLLLKSLSKYKTASM